MKPPNCHLCGRDLSEPYSWLPVEANANGLVQFADYLPLPDGMPGHPYGLEWFCTEHMTAAEALSDRSVEDAMAELRRAYPTPSRIHLAPATDRLGVLRRLTQTVCEHLRLQSRRK